MVQIIGLIIEFVQMGEFYKIASGFVLSEIDNETKPLWNFTIGRATSGMPSSNAVAGQQVGVPMLPVSFIFVSFTEKMTIGDRIKKFRLSRLIDSYWESSFYSKKRSLWGYSPPVCILYVLLRKKINGHSVPTMISPTELHVDNNNYFSKNILYGRTSPTKERPKNYAP